MKVQKFNTATNKRELDLVNLADLASEVTHAMGSQLDLPEYTFYVSPDFTQTGQFYNDLEDALDDATTDGNAHTIIVYRGTYTDNYDIANHTVYCFDGEGQSLQ